jgi:hypothetical protein
MVPFHARGPIFDEAAQRVLGAGKGQLRPGISPRRPTAPRGFVGDAEIGRQHAGTEKHVDLARARDIGEQQQAADFDLDARFLGGLWAAPTSRVSSFSMNPAGIVQ